MDKWRSGWTDGHNYCTSADYSWKVVYGGENRGWERKINDLWCVAAMAIGRGVQGGLSYGGCHGWKMELLWANGGV
ncbi:hypothetical protein Peur_015973 [Populus x canadensis]